MPIPGTVQITGQLAPTATTDVFATHDAQYGRGGAREVVDHAARDAYGTTYPARCDKGMLVVTQNDNLCWQLNTATPAGTSSDWTAFGTGGGGGISTLTTTGSTGASTLAGTTLNVPNYSITTTGAPGIATGWDTSDQSPGSTGLNFSGTSNITVDNYGASAYGMLRSTSHKVQGKKYIELHLDDIGSGYPALRFALAFGFWQKGQAFPSDDWSTTGNLNCSWTNAGSQSLATTYTNSVSSTQQDWQSVAAAGTVLCMRLDVGVGWQVRINNGNWVDVGNVYNNGGGSFFEAPVTDPTLNDMAVWVALGTGQFGPYPGTHIKVTLRTTAATQTYPAGTGWTAWDDVAPLEVAANTVRLADVQQSGFGPYYVPNGFPVIKDVEAALHRLGPLAATNGLCDNYSTTGLPEGSNLYYTDARAKAALSQNIQSFTSGTSGWTKPAGAKWVTGFVMGAGGGGGSGRKGVAGTVACGGGGGGAGSVMAFSFPASILGSTEVVTVPVGGAGGAAVSANSTNGNNGAAGLSASFGNWALAVGGGGGAGGTATTGTAGAGSTGFPNLTSNNGTAGGAASTTGGVGGAGVASILAASGGGAGGGISSANVAANGGNGGTVGSASTVSGYPILQTGGVGGTGGTAGLAGSGAASYNAPYSVIGASGGGGGGAGTATNGGGAGGGGGSTLGCGGGGGGAARDTTSTASGAGGTGGPGYVVVITTF